MTLVDQLQAKRFEFGLSIVQTAYYWLERKAGHVLLRRPPPETPGSRLLNLGCGPHIFEGWVNADDYAFKRRLRERSFRPNWALDITRPWLCPDDYWDGVFTEHVIEHLSYSEAVSAFRESFRTLKPGARIRVSVPDLRTYVGYYNGEAQAPDFPDFPHPAIAMSFLTQMHLHRSAWDADLMTRLLEEIGFVRAEECAFGLGADPRLVRDDPDKAHESLYVEAQKP